MTTPHEHSSSFVNGELIENLTVAPDHFRLTLRLSPSFATPHPGQFVMIRDPERGESLLPRPLSVYGFRREGGCAILELLCRVAGRGTALFSRMKPGAPLTVLGPLGKGFTIHDGIRQVILLAGGVGVAPLAFLLHERCLKADPQQKREITAYVGARTAELLTGLDRLEGFCGLRIATDDGSTGYHGLVTQLFHSDLQGYRPEETMVYACGPDAMVRSLGVIMGQSPIRCEVSLEARMACGIGACLGCAVAVRDGDGKSAYRRVCHDGPVFDLREIALDPCPNEQDNGNGIG